MQSRFLRVLSVTASLANAASQGMLYGMVFWMSERGGVSVGAGFSVLAGGALLGSWVTPGLKSMRYQLLLAGSLAVWVLVGLAGYLARDPWVVVGALAAGGMVSQPLSVILLSHVMGAVPDAVLGRVQGALYLVGSLFYPFGAAVTGAVAARWSFHVVFGVWGALLCLPLLASLLPAWRLPAEGVRVSLPAPEETGA